MNTLIKNSRQKRWRDKQQLLGRCIACGGPKERPTIGKCAKCHTKHYADKKKRREKYVVERRCLDCGASLHDIQLYRGTAQRCVSCQMVNGG